MASGWTSGWNWGWFGRKGASATGPHEVLTMPVWEEPRVGLALGGGFARGLSHVGVLKVLERENIPLHCITGVSAGAIVAAAYASGRTPEEIGAAGAKMRFSDVARWSFSFLGLAASERMTPVLQKLLRQMQFEDMRIPLGVVATDIRTGKPIAFRDHGDVALAIRASCSYPGLFRPLELNGRMFIDGAMSVEVPTLLARMMGATRVVAVHLPHQDETFEPHNFLHVIHRSFQIMMAHNVENWRRHTDIVITPDVGAITWDGFENAQRMIEAGEAAAEKALPEIRRWLGREPAALSGKTA